MEQFDDQTSESPMLQLHKNTDIQTLEKIIKVFKNMFVVFKFNDDEIEENGFTIYPPANTAIKKKLAKFFDIETKPKEIAEYLLLVTENRIKEINKHTFQNEIVLSIQQKKYPVILFENKENKNQLIGYRALPFFDLVNKHFTLYFFNDDPLVLQEQIKLDKYPSLILFSLQEVQDQPDKQGIAGMPFQQTLNFNNMLTFLLSFYQKNIAKDEQTQDQNQQEENLTLSKEINLFTTNKDQTLENCNDKICVLAFFKKEFDTEEKLQEVTELLQNVQGYFNKSATEVYLLDAGCYYDKLTDLDLSWDFLPNLVIYNRKEKSLYPLQDKFDEKGIKRGIIKVQKNLIQKKQLEDFIVFENKDCLEANEKLKKKLEKLKNPQVDDELMNEVIEESRKREKQKENVQLSKKEKRKQRLEQRRKQREEERMNKKTEDL